MHRLTRIRLRDVSLITLVPVVAMGLALHNVLIQLAALQFTSDRDQFSTPLANNFYGALFAMVVCAALTALAVLLDPYDVSDPRDRLSSDRDR